MPFPRKYLINNTTITFILLILLTISVLFNIIYSQELNSTYCRNVKYLVNRNDQLHLKIRFLSRILKNLKKGTWQKLKTKQ